MNRVKKRLHEWDENLKDDSLPTNAIGKLLLMLIWMDYGHNTHADTHARAHIHTALCVFFFFLLSFVPSPFLLFVTMFCLLPVRLLLQSGGLSAN